MADAESSDYLIPLLEPDGSNYLIWKLDIREALTASGLEAALDLPPPSSNPVTPALSTSQFDRAPAISHRDQEKALSFIRLRLHGTLKEQLFHISKPAELWKALADHFLGMKRVLLPAARHDWSNLRVMDYPSIEDYSAELYRVRVQLTLCEEPPSEASMIEKTLCSLGEDREILREIYDAMNFTSISRLLEYLKVVEQKNIVAKAVAAQRPLVPHASALSVAWMAIGLVNAERLRILLRLTGRTTVFLHGANDRTVNSHGIAPLQGDINEICVGF